MFTLRRYTPDDLEAVEYLHVYAIKQAGAYLGRGPWDDDVYAIEAAGAARYKVAQGFHAPVFPHTTYAPLALHPLSSRGHLGIYNELWRSGRAQGR